MLHFKNMFLRIAACVAAVLAFAHASSAQQITYYNFDTPATTPDLTSYTCPASAVLNQLPNVLFCLNNIYGQIVEPNIPNYLNDPAVSVLNPAGTNPNYSVELTTPAQQQASSLWFSVPQQVSSGFTAYFAVKITPNANSYATADGIAFVLQNSMLTNPVSNSGGADCPAAGSGANIVGAAGGCMGYGGIDNSLAVELDTYLNVWDPVDIPGSNNDNHVAVQSCGALANSPNHTPGGCLVALTAPPTGTPFTAAINSALTSIFADGNVHQVVITYSGPTEAIPNLLQVYIDPAFNPGTHTPVAGSIPAISGIYNIPANLSLPNGTAYVGFTSGTGAAFEQHELLAFTYTPHTSVTQTQPLNPPGTPTVFPFGGHSYSVTYPASQNPTGFNMTVTANTISPTLFQSLVAGGVFQGAQCQVYDETGGNCIVYSVSCTEGTTPAACPSIPSGDPDFIAVTTVFNNSTPLVTPGYLQGDPLYTQIASITGTGNTASLTCTGECSVTVGQTVTIAGSSIAGLNATVTVLSVPAPNIFTYASGVTTSSPATGGYVTSTNVQNIFTSYTDTAAIDSGVSGKTKNFSDFVVTSVTPVATMLAISAPASAAYGQPIPVVITATSTNGSPTGNVTLTVDSNTVLQSSTLMPLSGSSIASTANFNLTGLSAGMHTIYVSYPTTGVFPAANTSAPISVTATPLANVSATSLNFGTLYLGGIGIQSVTLSNVGDAPLSVNTPFLFDVGNGDSKEFIALNLCPANLAAGKSCSILVAFIAGPSYNTQTAILKIMDNSPGSPQSVNLVANVINPQASFSPRSLSFGAQSVQHSASQPVALTNTGTTPLIIAKVVVSGKNAGDYVLSMNGCTGSTLQPNASCSLGITFTPTATGSRTASIVVSDNVNGGTQQVPLSGTGK